MKISTSEIAVHEIAVDDMLNVTQRRLKEQLFFPTKCAVRVQQPSALESFGPANGNNRT